MTALQFALLGLGAGAVYALLANGLVVIHRGSGVLNFAHGAMAMAGAYIFYELHDVEMWSFAPSAVLAVAITAAIGALTHLLIMRRLALASTLVKIIATLGVLGVLEGIATIKYAGSVTIVNPSLPQRPIIIGSLHIPEDRIWLLGIALVITVVLHLVSKHTTWGLATTAVAENPTSAATLGWSPDLVATVTWAVGSGLAGLAGLLIAPLTGLDVVNLPLVVMAAMAGALVGGFRSYGLATAGGIVIGVVSSITLQYVTTPGYSEAIPFVIIMVVLIVRGRAIPTREHVVEHLPRIGRSGSSLATPVVLATGLAVLMSWVLPGTIVQALTVQIVASILLLSVVVLTGYAGQLSLAQFAVAGVGALIAGQLVTAAHLPFALSMLVAVVAMVPIGVAFGLPALRTRGVSLAVVTLGLGISIQDVIFSNPQYTGGTVGIALGATHFLGIDVDPVAHPTAYALFCLVWLALASLCVLSLRRSRAGRRLIAVRGNERAASSLGVNVVSAKLYAFCLASSIAGLSGVLLGFENHTIIFSSFDPVSSVNAIGNTVVGGLGYTSGGVIGSTLVTGGLGTWILHRFGGLDDWLLLIGGASLLLIVTRHPEGLAGAASEVGDWLRARLPRLGRKRAEGAATYETQANPPVVHADRRAALTVEGLSVRFGGTYALKDVSLVAHPGQVTGLIGPNGAGKTTLIDAVSGFVQPEAGRIMLGARRIDKLKIHARVASGLARSFQSLELFEDLTVWENLQVADDPQDRLAYLSGLVPIRGKPLGPGAGAAIAEFGLSDQLARRPTQLPHGQRRLLGIARAVAVLPSALLLDEPAAGLDRVETSELSRLIRRMATEWGITVVVVEHDMDLVMGVCDRIIVLDRGQQIADGTPAEIRASPAVIQAYLGEDESVADTAAVPSP